MRAKCARVRAREANDGNRVVKMPRADLTKQILLRADQVICGLNRTREELNLRMRIAAGVHQPLPSGHPTEKVICLENNYERGVLNGAFLKLSDVWDEDEESFSAKITSDDCEIGDDGTRCSIDKESFLVGQRSNGPRELVKACWVGARHHSPQGPRIGVAERHYHR